MGNGHCKYGYYTSWDGKGIANQDACNRLCPSEKQCTFVAYFNDGQRQTCSHYRGKTCIMDTSSDYKRAFFLIITYIDQRKFWAPKLWTLNFGKIFSIADNFGKKILDI